MIRVAFLFTLMCIPYAGRAQSPQVQALLRQAEAKKDQKLYATLLHKADSLSAGDMATQALVNKKLGAYYFVPDPDKSIHHLRLAVSYYSILNDKPNVALGLQSLAFVHDEGKFSVANAIPYAEQALAAWKELNDTLQMANMYKYVGLLQGKISRGADAKQNIANAIQLYEAKNHEAGIAVSWHNLAIVNQYVRQYDTALAYIGKAKDYWRGKDSSRLFELNNLALEITLAMNDHSASLPFYNENLALFNDKFSWSDRLNFYSNSINYLYRLGNEKDAKAVSDKHRVLYDSLKKKSVVRADD